MKLVFRCDGDGRIGGGHVMRCLTLASAAQARGWSVRFVMAEGGFTDRVKTAGIEVVSLPPGPLTPDEDAPPHGAWLKTPWEKDAELTRAALDDADWLIWDHYGLDARWVGAVGAKQVLAFDDIDDRPLGSDALIDLTRLEGRPHNCAPVHLSGPGYAPLRPEFSQYRQDSLARRIGAQVKHVLVMPGLADAAGLAPLALKALSRIEGIDVEVIMGAASQSLRETERLLDAHRLSLDPPDLTQRMVAADLCIGGSGMTNWERCALGLPTVAIAVADNQVPGLTGLVKAGAVVPLTLEQAQDLDRFTGAIHEAISRADTLSRNAAQLCDGLGADRVLNALDWRFRPLEKSDQDRLYHWRNSPEIRAVSHSSAPLDPRHHQSWIDRTLNRQDGVWSIYCEGGRPLGFASAVPGESGWVWSFYLGEPAPKGTGTRMMQRFLDHLTERGVRDIRGEVKATNMPSVALHKRLGFRQVDDQDGVLVFARRIGETHS